MPVRLRCIFLVLALAVALAACGGDDSGDAGATEAPGEITGVITEIESEGLDQVNSFVVKDGDDVYNVLIATDVDYGFPLGHLHEHRATGDPVRVELETRNGDLYALAIEDV